jgi:hypothetical protein
MAVIVEPLDQNPYQKMTKTMKFPQKDVDKE